MPIAPLFSQAVIDAMRDAYADVGIPVTIQDWNPSTRTLEPRTVWLDGRALPGPNPLDFEWD